MNDYIGRDTFEQAFADKRVVLVDFENPHLVDTPILFDFQTRTKRLHVRMKNEIRDWLEETIPDCQVDDHIHGTYLIFKTPAEAIQFKLTFNVKT